MSGAVWVVREDRRQEGYPQTYRILTTALEEAEAWRGDWYTPGVAHHLTRAEADDMVSKLNGAPRFIEAMERELRRHSPGDARCDCEQCGRFRAALAGVAPK